MDLEAMLARVVDTRASDLFITAGQKPLIKIDGNLQEVTDTVLSSEQAMELVLSIMSPKQRAEFEVTLECQFALSMPDLGRFRVSAFIQRSSAGMVLRRIESDIPTLEMLNMPTVLNDLIMFKRGLLVVVGGTGTGKSSTLAALIRHRNENSIGHIVTVEDPIEFIHPHQRGIVTQREIGLDTESFEVALKNTLRQAPDVILIGEVRSREAMQHALTFAETGHLCVCTLHASNADQALDRILHFFPEESTSQVLMDLSLNIRGIIAQQLVPAADGKGRYPAIEVLLNTPLVSDHIRKGELHKLKELMKNSRELGMQTFDQALYELFAAGKIGYEDALHAADSRNELRLQIKLGAATAAMNYEGDGSMMLTEIEGE
jgi:twitching motility protein PilU